MNETTNIASETGTAPLETPLELQASAPAEARPRGWLDAVAQPIVAIPLLTIFGALIFLVNLGGYPFYTKGEPREAVTVLAMATGGGVILPMRAGIELPSKPLLMHWVAALLSMLFGGVSEWTRAYALGAVRPRGGTRVLLLREAPVQRTRGADIGIDPRHVDSIFAVRDRRARRYDVDLFHGSGVLRVSS